jgi:hypothetical protein
MRRLVKIFDEVLLYVSILAVVYFGIAFVIVSLFSCINKA